MTPPPVGWHAELLQRLRTPSGTGRVVPLRAAARTPVAFLACFTPSYAGLVFPLKRGVNRVGRDVAWGDHEPFPERVMEGRQWLVVCGDGAAWVADDHSTNQSVLIPDGPPLAAADPRYSADGRCDFAALSATADGRAVPLDWAGDVVAPLRQGDVLVTTYAGFVFGWVPNANPA